MRVFKTCTLAVLALMDTLGAGMQAQAGVHPFASDTDCDTFQSCIKALAEIPIPNTAWLLALGLVCLIGLKRKG